MPTQTKPALPFAPYEGAEPYIFVSYAHANADRVYPVIARLNWMGYRLWYDRGIPPSAVWMETIMQRLDEAKYVLLFVSPEAIASDYVFMETSVARDKRPPTPLCPVFLAETKLSHRFRGYLHILQSVFCYEQPDGDAVIEEIARGLPGLLLNLDVLEPPEPTPKAPQKRVYKMRQKTKRIVVPLSALKTSYTMVSSESDSWWEGKGDGTVSLLDYNGTSNKVTFPSMCQGTRVRKIGRYPVWSDDEIQTVIIPEGITEIANLAFSKCYCLTDIWIPGSVTIIAKQAFGHHRQTLTFHCPRGSYAEQYAKEHDINIIYTD